MNQKQDISALKGVPETLLITLYARKLETERTDGLFRDPKAVEIVSQIDYDFSRFDGHPAMPSLALRVKVIDDAARAFLEKTPYAVVVQLGAGLDARFQRLDDGRVIWYELDLPQTVTLRQKFFQPTRRHLTIGASVMDFNWMDHIPGGRPVLFIAEGLLYYLEEAEAEELLQVLVERFPSSTILFDTVPKIFARLSLRMGAQTKTSLIQTRKDADDGRTPWLWGCHDARAFTRWEPRLKQAVHMRFNQRYHPDFPAYGRLLGKIPLLRRMISPLVVLLAW